MTLLIGLKGWHFWREQECLQTVIHQCSQSVPSDDSMIVHTEKTI